MASDRDSIRAESFQWTSSFGKAVGQGNMRSGKADIDIDFGRLAAMIRPIIDFSDTTLSGSATGNINWDASTANVWRLSGQGNATNLLITLPTGQRLKRNSLRGEVEAVGRWGQQTLQSLSEAKVTVNTDSLEFSAELLEPVNNPSPHNPMPIGIVSKGRLETLQEVIGPWLPSSIHLVTGAYDLRARSDVSTDEINLHFADLKLLDPLVKYSDRTFRQRRVTLKFTGDLTAPSLSLQARELNVSGDDFAAAIVGSAGPADIDLNVKWNADLLGLQSGVPARVAGQAIPLTNKPPSWQNPVDSISPRDNLLPTSIRTVSFQSGVQQADTKHWVAMGNCKGDFRITRDNDWIQIEHETTGKEIALLQPTSSQYQAVGPQSPASQMRPLDPMPSVRPVQPASTKTLQFESRTSAAGSSRVVWFEPNIKLGGVLRIAPSTGQYVAQGFDVAGDWFATTMDGTVLWNQSTCDIRLSGPARLKMDEVGRRLTPMAGTDIQLSGVHETMVSINVTSPEPDDTTQDYKLNLQADLGWESGRIAGVDFGQARVPITMTQTSVIVSPSEIPIGRGFVRAAGKVHYRPGTVWMQLDPGVVANSIELTPEMTAGWLKYLAPLAANTARIRGTVSAEVTEANIVFSDSNRTRIVGQLNLGGAEMMAGPVANQLIGTIKQLTSLAGALGSNGSGVLGSNGSATLPAEKTLVSMPPQTVDFTVDRGIVSHDRLYFEVDRAQVVTSGRVSMDGQLDLIAQVPLDARWLGKNLQGLAGQNVTLPIDGTFTRPSLDSSGVTRVVGELGTKAIQQTTENYLQKQMERGLDKIFGR